jgi:hypothetical protein
MRIILAKLPLELLLRRSAISILNPFNRFDVEPCFGRIFAALCLQQSEFLAVRP